MSITEEQKERAGRQEPTKIIGTASGLNADGEDKSVGACHRCHQTQKPSERHADFTEHTWTKFLTKKLLNEDNFGLQRDIQGEVWATLVWTHCLEYEHQLRKEALRLCFEERYSIQEALWTAYSDLPTRNKTLDAATRGGKQQKRQQQRGPTEYGSLGEEGGREEDQILSTSTSSNQERKQGHEDHQKAASKSNVGKGNKGTGKADYVIGTGSQSDDFMSTVGATEKLHKKNWTPPGFC